MNQNNSPLGCSRDLRRRFLAAAGAAAAGLAASRLVSAQATQPTTRPRAVPPEMPNVQKAPKQLSILILGGTGFIGPFQVQHARARGHKLTIANRGRTRPEIFEGLDVEHIQYDRDAEPVELQEAVRNGRKWDVVIDNIGYLPKHVDTPLAALKDAVGQYIFISSISVYEPLNQPGADEDWPTLQMTDEEAAGATMKDMNKWYGHLKRRCELAVEAAIPQGATIVRPGLIVGPGDPTDRFTYWPVRTTLESRCGGRMLVAGTEENPAPIQVIDVRDLAGFIITLAENKAAGEFNAIGPTENLKDTVEAAKAHSGVGTQFVYVPMSFLAAEKVAFWAALPAIVGDDPESIGFTSASNARSTAAGLETRPIAQTVAATLDWWKTLPADRRARIENPPEQSPLMKELRESELLAKWSAQQTSGPRS